MVEKPPTGDTQQRRDQTEAARYQSGLPPEPAPEQNQTPEQDEKQRRPEERDAD